jgi:hypothetical protein
MPNLQLYLPGTPEIRRDVQPLDKPSAPKIPVPAGLSSFTSKPFPGLLLPHLYEKGVRGQCVYDARVGAAVF